MNLINPHNIATSYWCIMAFSIDFKFNRQPSLTQIAVLMWQSLSQSGDKLQELHTVNPPISHAALVKKHFNFLRCLLNGGAYPRALLISKLGEKRTEIMCQNLFTGRIICARRY